MVNPHDNRNNNTNKTQPGQLPVDQEYHQKDMEHYSRAAHYNQHHHFQKTCGPDSGGTGHPEENCTEHGFSHTSIGSVERLHGVVRHSHRSHRHRTRESREAHSTCPHHSEVGEGNNEHRRHHRRTVKEGEEGRRCRSKGTEGNGKKGTRGDGGKQRHHLHSNQERGRGHRSRK